MRATFRRAERIRSSREFREVVRDGHHASSPLLVLYAKPNALGHTRFGISCEAKKFSKASERNRIKRRLRELIRVMKHQISHGWDVVVVARQNGRCEFGRLRQEWEQLVKHANLTA